MLNFDIDPAVLAPLVPAGTELDQFNGRTVVSLVGFLFLGTRVLGLSIPLHRNFEEVNLRFYVRRKVNGEWRRAVVFVKEFVPIWTIAAVAKLFYGENYAAVWMSHSIEPEKVSYKWRNNGTENSIQMTYHGESADIELGSEAEFITEHYWGYTAAGHRRTMEYEVTHPRWRVWKADKARFEGDATELYGNLFGPALSMVPTSAFLAEGSEIAVYRGKRLALR